MRTTVPLQRVLMAVALMGLSSLRAIASEPPELARLLAALARPAPAESAFVERRESPLLAEPLLLNGRLQQPARGTLIKIVEAPYVERTSVSDERVVVQRQQQPARKFSLRRAPELRALMASFEAVLSGDLALLQRHYTLDMQGSADAWRLALTPRDRRLARRVESLALLGSGEELHCMDLRQRGEERSRMWLGAAAKLALQSTSEAARDALCGGDGR